VLVPHRADAGSGRPHNDITVLEDLDVVAHQRQRLVEVAGVDMHLPAAGLGLGEHHLMAESLQQQHRGLGRVGEQGVGQAGGEQGDTHGASLGHPECNTGASRGLDGRQPEIQNRALLFVHLRN